MTVDHREKAFEEAIVNTLTAARGEVARERPEAAAAYPVSYTHLFIQTINIGYFNLEVVRDGGLFS